MYDNAGDGQKGEGSQGGHADSVKACEKLSIDCKGIGQ